MTKPRTLVLAIVSTAIAFTLALGSVLLSPTLDSASDSPAARPRQVALSAAPLNHVTPGQ